MSFCPVCGKKSNGFCENCKPAEEIKSKDIFIKICVLCDSYFKDNKWQKANLKDAILNISKSKIKDNVKIDLSNLNYEEILNNKKPGKQIELELNVIKDNNLYILPAEILFTYCDKCSKKNSKYFEGTLQIRNPSKEVLDYIEKYVQKNNINIADKRIKEKGFDYDLSDQRKLQNLAHNLKKNFGGNLKISIRQFTQDKLTSKQIYRVNALYECPDYKKGDVLKIENNLYLITNIEKQISAINLKTGKKTTIKEPNDYVILEKQKTKITKVYPNLEIMDPITYQSVSVKNTLNFNFKIGENVTLVIDEGYYYIIN